MSLDINRGKGDEYILSVKISPGVWVKVSITREDLEYLENFIEGVKRAEEYTEETTKKPLA